jgi:hypothetical protein
MYVHRKGSSAPAQLNIISGSFISPTVPPRLFLLPHTRQAGRTDGRTQSVRFRQDTGRQDQAGRMQAGMQEAGRRQAGGRKKGVGEANEMGWITYIDF